MIVQMANVGASADDDEPVVELQREASERERFIFRSCWLYRPRRQQARRFTGTHAARVN